MIKRKIKEQIRRLILWAAKKEIRDIVEAEAAMRLRSARAELTYQISQSVRKMEDQMTALLAIDVPVSRDAGKVIIIARVAGRDIVKIVDVSPSMSVQELRDLVETLQSRYGAQLQFIDAPPGSVATLALVQNLMRKPLLESSERAVQRGRNAI